MRVDNVAALSLQNIASKNRPNAVHTKPKEAKEDSFESKKVAMRDEDEIAIKEENINASKSRIHDVNMAEEVISITKSHMLDHSSHAILAQSNKQPEQVLKLLE